MTSPSSPSPLSLQEQLTAKDAENEALKKELKTVPALISGVRASNCIHSNYWVGVYGTCMACEKEKLVEENQRLREALLKIRGPLARVLLCGPEIIADDALKGGSNEKPSHAISDESLLKLFGSPSPSAPSSIEGGAVVEGKMIMKKCPYCKGTGKNIVAGAYLYPCQDCGGKGEYQVHSPKSDSSRCERIPQEDSEAFEEWMLDGEMDTDYLPEASWHAALAWERSRSRREG